MKANLTLVEKVEKVAKRLEATPAQVALAWVLAQGETVLPIPGTKRLKYLEENLGAAQLNLTPEVLTELDNLPSPVGGRY